MSNLIRTTVQIRDTQHEALSQLSRPGKSFSFLVREAIDKYLVEKSIDSIDDTLERLNDYEHRMKNILQDLKG
tara:strand:+ start:195 stop:413 length:219 start_codon:yes stop_codon:yes gene_type:complete